MTAAQLIKELRKVDPDTAMYVYVHRVEEKEVISGAIELVQVLHFVNQSWLGEGPVVSGWHVERGEPAIVLAPIP